LGGIIFDGLLAFQNKLDKTVNCGNVTMLQAEINRQLKRMKAPNWPVYVATNEKDRVKKHLWVAVKHGKWVKIMNHKSADAFAMCSHMSQKIYST